MSVGQVVDYFAIGGSRNIHLTDLLLGLSKKWRSRSVMASDPDCDFCRPSPFSLGDFGFDYGVSQLQKRKESLFFVDRNYFKHRATFTDDFSVGFVV
jgi:hypothetical protein